MTFCKVEHVRLIFGFINNFGTKKIDWGNKMKQKIYMFMLVLTFAIVNCGGDSTDYDFTDFTGSYVLRDDDCVTYDASKNLDIQPSNEMLSVSTDYEAIETWLMAGYDEEDGYRYSFRYEVDSMICYVSFVQDQADIETIESMSTNVNASIGDVWFDCQIDSGETCSIIYK
jgi:hypothetical protein